MREKFLFIVSLCFGLFLAILNFLYYSPFGLLGNDTIAWILAGVGPILKIGVAYKDYWDRMPPGLALIVFLWAKTVGYSDFSFQILHFVSLLALIPLFYLVFRKINFSLIVLPAAISSLLISFAPALVSFPLTSEQLGLFFALLGLVMLLYKKDNFIFIFLGSFSLFLASQMKDPFGASIICLIPLFIYYFVTNKGLKKAIAYSLGGVLSGLLVMATYLLYLGNLKEYLEILNYKNSAFEISNLHRLFSYLYILPRDIINSLFQYIILFPAIPIVVFSMILADKIFIKKDIILRISPSSLTLINKSKEIFNLKKITDLAIILFYIFGSYLGLAFQGDLSSHRLIQIALPSTLLITSILLLITKPLHAILYRIIPRERLSSFLSNTAILFMVFLFTFPRTDIIFSYKFESLSQKLQDFTLVREHESNVFDFIKNQTNPQDCIVYYHAWAVEQAYYYSQRKPCTKFIKPQLIMAYPKYLKEAREELRNNPPKLIYYKADPFIVDIDRFQSEVLNFDKLIERCYQKTNYQLIYLPKEKDEEKFRRCYNSFFEN